MRIRISLLALSLGFLSTAGCGDDDITGLPCCYGTVSDEDGQCVPDDDGGDPTTRIAPSGGQIPAQSAVTLIADEPATIYYTIDGSEPDTGSPSGETPVVIQGLPVEEGDVTVRFFARDDDGNSESPKMAMFTLDVAPGAVTGLAVDVTDDDAAVSWTPPTDDDFVGVVVAKVDGVITSPATGQTVAVDDELGPGTTVVYVGTDTSYAGADLAPGFHQYAVWAYDSWGNYSRVRTAGDQVALPAQTGSMTVDVAALTATFTSPTLAPVTLGPPGSVSFAAGTLTVPLQVGNMSNRVLYNVKFVMTDVTGTAGALSGTDGTIGVDSDPYYHVAAGVAPGGEEGATQDLVMTGVGGTDTVVITFEVMNHPLVLGPTQWNGGDESGQLFDTGTDQLVDEGLADLAHMAIQAPPQYFGGGISLDGRRLYVGGRQANHLAVIDLATMEEVVRSANLTTGKGVAIWPILMSDEDVVWTAVTQGTHGYYDSSAIGELPRRFFLVKLDASTLEELGRVELTSAQAGEEDVRARVLAISADRSMAAIAFRDNDLTFTSGEVHLVDLASMSEIDADGDTEGVQPVLEVSTTSSLAFAPDGSKLYVGQTDDVPTSDVQVIDLVSGSYEVTTVTVGHAEGAHVGVGPDGLIYVGTHTSTAGMWTIDPADDSVDPLTNYTQNVAGMTWDANGTLWTIPWYDSDDVCHVDLTDEGAETCIAGDSGEHNGHWIAITPF